MYETFFIAQANENPGAAVIGLLMIAGFVWMLMSIFKPKNKGVVIDHQGRTTVKPRK